MRLSMVLVGLSLLLAGGALTVSILVLLGVISPWALLAALMTPGICAWLLLIAAAVTMRED